MHPRLKKRIFDKLYNDLSHAEIIDCKNSIWFIDRETKYWYLEYEKSGDLYWRYQFFINFFRLFSMEQSEYERVIAEWVEEVLNCKVDATAFHDTLAFKEVEEVLNCKVDATGMPIVIKPAMVEEVLNCKVDATKRGNERMW